MKRNFGLLACGFFIQLATMSFGRFAYTLILPQMMKELSFTSTKMGILGTGIIAGYLLNSFFSGKLSHIIGSEKTVNISVFLSSISLFSLGFFKNIILIFLAFMGLGASASGSYIPLIAILNQRIREKGTAFGIVMGGTGVGIMLCGYIIPPLLLLPGIGGYRIAWYALGAINMLVLIPSMIILKPYKKKESIHDQTPSKQKVLNMVFRDISLLIVIFIYFIVGFSYIIYSTYFGVYSIQEVGFSVKSTGFMWSFFGINTIYSGIVAGILSDRYNKINIALILISILSISTFLIIPLKISFIFYISAFLFGFSFMGLIILIVSIISDFTHKHLMAQTFGVSTLIHGSGQVIGVYLAGFLKDLKGTYRVPLLLSFMGFLICCFLLLYLKKLIDNSETCERS